MDVDMWLTSFVVLLDIVDEMGLFCFYFPTVVRGVFTFVVIIFCEFYYHFLVGNTCYETFSINIIVINNIINNIIITIIITTIISIIISIISTMMISIVASEISDSQLRVISINNTIALLTNNLPI